jgi:hypothetical protein
VPHRRTSLGSLSRPARSRCAVTGFSTSSSPTFGRGQGGEASSGAPGGKGRSSAPRVRGTVLVIRPECVSDSAGTYRRRGRGSGQAWEPSAAGHGWFGGSCPVGHPGAQAFGSASRRYGDTPTGPHRGRSGLWGSGAAPASGPLRPAPGPAPRTARDAPFHAMPAISSAGLRQLHPATSNPDRAPRPAEPPRRQSSSHPQRNQRRRPARSRRRHREAGESGGWWGEWVAGAVGSETLGSHFGASL